MFKASSRSTRARVALVLAATIAMVTGVASPGLARDKAGKVTEFSAGINPFPFGLTAGPDGNLWYTEYGDVRGDPSTFQPVSGTGGIGRITPKGKVTEFTTGLSPQVQPGGIIAGPDGNLWFGEANNQRVGRITPDGVITEFLHGPADFGGAGGVEVGITAGPDGNLWYNDSGFGGIGRITPAGVVTEFPAGIGKYPRGIPIAGPDGNLWFNYDQPLIGRITPAGVITDFSAGLTDEITAGPDGNLWFIGSSEYDPAAVTTSWIGRITPDGVVTEFTAGLTAGVAPRGITVGPDGNLWFTEFGEKRIGRITPAGVITEFSAGIAAAAHPSDITVGCDGNLWFTEIDEEGSGTRGIGRITPKGKVTEFSKGITGTPSGITAGPDGNLWFTETDHGLIGRFDLGPPAKPRGQKSTTLPAACPRARQK